MKVVVSCHDIGLLPSNNPKRDMTQDTKQNENYDTSLQQYDASSVIVAALPRRLKASGRKQPQKTQHANILQNSQQDEQKREGHLNQNTVYHLFCPERRYGRQQHGSPFSPHVSHGAASPFPRYPNVTAADGSNNSNPHAQRHPLCATTRRGEPENPITRPPLSPFHHAPPLSHPIHTPSDPPTPR